MNTMTINDRKISKTDPTYLIAEIGVNHNGDLELAKDMIRTAATTGVDSVKFQTCTAETLMTQTAGTADHLEAGAGEETVYEFVDRISFTEEEHRELYSVCKEENVTFLSSAFSERAVNLLESLGVSAFKIASMDLDNLPLLEYVGQTGKPIILSTGMGTLGEVEKALETLYDTGNTSVALLHCVSLYPPDPEDVNLRAMDTLKQSFQVPVGFSDHTTGTNIPIAAMARGARILEKHFTLDRSLPGPDQAVSGEPSEFSRLAESAETVHRSLGNGQKQPSPDEFEMREAFRRSIVSTRDLPEDKTLTREDVTFKRPATGISPSQLDWVLGRKTSESISADTVIQRNHLQ